jgi:hypothetical protein
MSEEQALIPIETREVLFYGDSLVGALVVVDGERRIYVPVRPLCRYLGLAWGSQRNRITRDAVLRTEVRGVFITNTPQSGGTQETLCLPLDMIPGFLFGIVPSRVKPEFREQIIRYQRECYRALWDAFKYDILPAADLAPPEVQPPGTGGAELAYQLAMAVANLARQQMEIEQRLDSAGRWARGPQ